MKRLLLAPALFLAALLPLAAQIDTPLQTSSDPVKAALTRVISSQLAAFKVADFPKAYTFAAREIQEVLSPRLFEKMVRANYSGLMEDAPATFGVALDDGKLGIVFLEIDSSRGPEVFRYLLKWENGAWKIASVEQTSQDPPRKAPLSA